MGVIHCHKMFSNNIVMDKKTNMNNKIPVVNVASAKEYTVKSEVQTIEHMDRLQHMTSCTASKGCKRSKPEFPIQDQ